MKHPFPELPGKAILSPMAGVTDVAFRALCRKYGAALTVTEFTSAAAIARGSAKAEQMLKTAPEERPVAVQLFGHSEEDVIEAAKSLQDRFDVIDINCGCPAWKVVKSGAGSAMLEDPDRIARFVEMLVRETQVPITVKIRTGVSEERINALEVAGKIERAGASALAIHGRTQRQGYSGKADWKLIGEVKRSVKIPVIGNGDVFTPEDFKRVMDESGVDYIMLARGAIGNPHLFTQINDYLSTGEYRALANVEQMGLFDEYLALALEYGIPFAQIKMHAQSFTKGQTGGKRFREALVGADSIEKLKELLAGYRRELSLSERNL